MHTPIRNCIIKIGVCALLITGCVNVTPPPNPSVNDPSDPSAPEASTRRLRPNLVATTQVYLDPSVGQGAQKMDHSKMPGMEGMQMDHSKMPGMDAQPSPAASPSQENLKTEMKRTSEEMKKTSEELKKKAGEAPQQKSSPSASGDHSQMQADKSPAPPPPQSKAVYTCVMHPEVQADKPGDCPKCGMKLVPKSAR